MLRLFLRCFYLLLAMAVVSCRPARPPQPPPQPPPGVMMEKLTGDILIKNVNIVDVEKGIIIRGQDVLVKNEKIVYLGEPKSFIRAAEVKDEIEGEGKFLLPGLWDMHVHTMYHDFYPWQFPLMLANGIIGFRDMWGDLKLADSLRQEMQEGNIPAFHFNLSGHIVDGKKPYWPGSLALPDIATALKIVDSLAGLGSDFIKIYSSLTPEVFHAIAGYCREKNIPFLGHVPHRVSVTTAAKAGMATMEHLYGLAIEAATAFEEIMDLGRMQMEAYEKGMSIDSQRNIARRARDLQLSTFSADRLRAIAKILNEQNTIIVPTLVANRGYYFSRDSSIRYDERLRYMPGFLRVEWKGMSENSIGRLSPDDWAKRTLVFENEKEIIRILWEENVTIMAGTDIFNPYTYAGFSLHDELALFVESGMTNAAALRTATINPSRYMKMSDSLGTVEEGKRADLVLLDGDPLTDIHNTKKIFAVISGGRVYRSPELAEMKRKVEELHKPGR